MSNTQIIIPKAIKPFRWQKKRSFPEIFFPTINALLKYANL